ncbi:hypothetical protein STANM309S_04613 [Streptomyces tanashiensis]
MWKFWLIQLISESRYFGKFSTMSTICPASIEPRRTTKPTPKTVTAKKTRNVARPRRIPRAAMRPTAGSIARARKKASRMLTRRPTSWWKAQLPSWKTA